MGYHYPPDTDRSVQETGCKLERTYQLNNGGNTDFLNMLNYSRLASKKKSKTEAVESVTGRRLDDEDIHIGLSNYVPWQKDNKVCFIRMEGKLFGDAPMNLELRFSVEDSPNFAGITHCCHPLLQAGLKPWTGRHTENAIGLFLKTSTAAVYRQ